MTARSDTLRPDDPHDGGDPDTPALPTGDVIHLFRFAVGRLSYGVMLSRVLEVLPMVTITAVPGAPEEVLGVINLRGTMLPVFDLPRLLSRRARPVVASQYIVVAEAASSYGLIPFGFVVDELNDVVGCSPDQLCSPGMKLGTPMSKEAGAVKLGDELVPLIDLDALVRADRVAMLVEPAIDEAELEAALAAEAELRKQWEAEAREKEGTGG